MTDFDFDMSFGAAGDSSAATPSAATPSAATPPVLPVGYDHVQSGVAMLPDSSTQPAKPKAKAKGRPVAKDMTCDACSEKKVTGSRWCKMHKQAGLCGQRGLGLVVLLFMPKKMHSP